MEISSKLRSFFMLASCLLVLSAHSQDYKQTQERIKSIYIYNFMKDIEWTHASGSETRICLLSSDGFKEELQKLTSVKKLDNKAITVEVIASPSECSACDVLFLDESQSNKKLKRLPDFKGLVITFGYYDKSLSNIALLFHENKLQFYINTELCDKLGFRISSHLSSLANQKLVSP